MLTSPWSRTFGKLMPGSMRASWQGRAAPSAVTAMNTLPQPFMQFSAGLVDNPARRRKCASCCRRFLRNSSVTASARTSCSRLGSKLVAVVVRPTVELGVGEFDEVGAHCLRHLDNLADLIDVEPMHHEVEHHRVVILLDQLGDCDSSDRRFCVLLMKSFSSLRRILERELDVIEPGLLQRLMRVSFSPMPEVIRLM